MPKKIIENVPYKEAYQARQQHEQQQHDSRMVVELYLTQPHPQLSKAKYGAVCRVCRPPAGKEKE